MGSGDGRAAGMTIAGANGRRRHVFTDERLLIFIAENSTQGRALRITKRQLAQSVGCSIAMADRGIRRLETKRLLKRLATHGPDGSQRENGYRLTPRGTLLAKALQDGIEYRAVSEIAR